jgi:hypothetical protein
VSFDNRFVRSFEGRATDLSPIRSFAAILSRQTWGIGQNPICPGTENPRVAFRYQSRSLVPFYFKVLITSGPPPHLQLRFDQIRRLPRKEQEFVIRFIDTVLEKAQKA